MDANSIRVACAEEMGFQPIEQSPPPYGEFYEKIIWEKDGRRHGIASLPKFDTDLNAAFSLVEAMRKESWHFRCSNIYAEMNWTVSAITHDKNHAVTNPNLCAAICELFLKTRGAWKE